MKVLSHDEIAQIAVRVDRRENKLFADLQDFKAFAERILLHELTQANLQTLVRVSEAQIPKRTRPAGQSHATPARMNTIMIDLILDRFELAPPDWWVEFAKNSIGASAAHDRRMDAMDSGVPDELKNMRWDEDNDD